MRLREVALLLVVLGIAAWLRFISATETQVDVPVRNDAREYVAYAYNLNTWGIYSKAPTWAQQPAAAPVPDAMRPPAYPEFLRLFLRGAPDEAFVARVVAAQAVLGMLVVLLGYFTARRILGFGAATAVALLLAICPQLVVYESYLLTETLFTVAVAAAMLVAALALSAESSRLERIWAVVFGVLLGVTALIRPTLLYLPVVLFAAALLAPSLRRYRISALLMVVAFAVTFAPWTVRNIVTTGHTSDPRLAIATLQGGSYPDFMYEGDPKSYGGPSSFDPRSGEISASSRTVIAEIARKFRADPLEYLRWYLIGKPIAFFSWNEISGWGWVFIYPVLRSPFLHDPAIRWVSAITAGLHWPLVVSAILSLFWIWTSAPRRVLGEVSSRILRFVSIVFAFVIVLHVIGTPLPRYGVPFRPLLYILAVSFIVVAGTFLRNRVAAAQAPAHNAGQS